MAWVNTSPLVKTYTLEEFWELPDPEDGAKLELIAGVLYLTPPPDYKHNEVVTTLIRLLDRHLIDYTCPDTPDFVRVICFDGGSFTTSTPPPARLKNPI